MNSTNADGGNEPLADGRIERASAHVWRIELPVDTIPPYDHTNAYLVVDAGVALLVDPGSDLPEALPLIRLALQRSGARLLKGVVLTHTHPDHTGGVGLVSSAQLTGPERLPVFAHTLEAPRLPAEWGTVHLQGERTLMVGDVALRCLHTPGHSPGHLTLLVENADEDRPEIALVGDLAAATGSVWVGLPEGDMVSYLASLATIQDLKPRLLGPGHGPLIADVQRRLSEMAEHRREREEQVLAALEAGPATSGEVTARVYQGLDSAVFDLAEKSVQAHLLKLMREMKVVHLGADESGPYAVRR